MPAGAKINLLGGYGRIGLQLVIGAFQCHEINEHSARGGRTGEGVQGHMDMIDTESVWRNGAKGCINQSSRSD